tara:strand:- start:3857 stop:4078 length:222 start_codon:yes stop_codon:yes gene_type:complete
MISYSKASAGLPNPSGYESENDKFWKNVPSKNDWNNMACPKAKTYTSSHTIAPAYNKGAYQVILNSEIKDIGR